MEFVLSPSPFVVLKNKIEALCMFITKLNPRIVLRKIRFQNKDEVYSYLNENNVADLTKAIRIYTNFIVRVNASRRIANCNDCGKIKE